MAAVASPNGSHGLRTSVRGALRALRHGRYGISLWLLRALWTPWVACKAAMGGVQDGERSATRAPSWPLWHPSLAPTRAVDTMDGVQGGERSAIALGHGRYGLPLKLE